MHSYNNEKKNYMLIYLPKILGFNQDMGASLPSFEIIKMIISYSIY